MYYDRVNTENKYKKLAELVCEFHPDFAEGTVHNAAIKADPKIYNMEYLIEKCFEFASEGAYTFIDGAKKDFTDGSDSKTATIFTSGDSWQCQITSVRSKAINGVAGNLKEGALRCVIYNPHFDKLHFLFVPHTTLSLLMSKVRAAATDLFFTWNLKKESFVCRATNDYIEFNSFKELAMEANR